LPAILAEIKTLFESYATANGKYEKIVGQSETDWDDRSEPGIDLMSPLSITGSDNMRPIIPNGGRMAEATKRVRGIGKSVTQTAKTLRSIVAEPKRLIWASVGKESFEQLISKLENLNSYPPLFRTAPSSGDYKTL
jgi:hypothetical protein